MNKGLTEGTVYKSTGSWYMVHDADGKIWNARIRGKLRIDKEIASTNPVAVGDTVIMQPEEGVETGHNASIKEVKPRNNYMVRVSPHNKNHKHIVAANLDLALVIATVTMPRTSQGFIDRFLITAEAYHIPALIIINKTDLLTKEKHVEQLAEWMEMYEAAGYEVMTMNALRPEDTEQLRERLRNKTTLFSGHSGVGKSTIINSLLPHLALRTGEVSDWSGKGQHTTTFAEMFDLPEKEGRIIDTPGVKEFGLIDFEPEEVSHYFPEMRALMSSCRFNNCLHTEEPGCAVKDAVAAGALDIARYESYLSILGTIEK